VIVNFKWIPRELNAEADRLSNVAMDQWKKE
jgi:ribonuclease HI